MEKFSSFKIDLKKELISKLPINFQNNFQKKLNENNNSFWQTISEVRGVIIFNNLDIQVMEVDAKTIKDKNVDFLAIFEDEKIYSEVKGFVPEDYEIAKEGSNYFNKSEYEIMIERAFRRADEKFLDENLNIAIIADENVVKSSLFREPLLYDLPKDILWDYPRISAAIVLGEYNNNDMLKYKIWHNDNAKKILPPNLIDIFDNNKTVSLFL